MGYDKNKGFTIVELLVVIVVIAILAAVTIIAYNGIANRTRSAQVDNYLTSALKAVSVFKTQSNDTLPTSLQQANLPENSNITTHYVFDDATKTFCIAAESTDGYRAYIDTSGLKKSGDCSGFGLVGHWTFNGSSNDSSGKDNHGTPVGVTLTDGMNGQPNGAYRFTSGSYIDLGNKSDFTSQVRTLAVWVKRDDTTVGTLFNTPEVYMYVNGIKPGLTSASGSMQPSGYVDTAWFHLAFVYNGISNKVRFYINGVHMTDFNITTNFTSPPTSRAWIGTTNILGSMTTPGRNSLKGVMDDMWYFSRELSLEEIQALYAAGAQ